ncbi:TIGR00341 family protein [Romeria aff. gracilis LEGE 07310]|uniref:TIGR00341 family protein n=1 Tax=Vasconcelosia minhoensis LEGE 07310 TaxID=915328 RepID=A0A8J7DKD7_9CYAN|nr:TIGR00341 family protein [Romeria aff. gracilis LEGE 07310]
MALLRFYLPQRYHRPVIRTLRRFRTTWAKNSGDWKWLEGRPVSLANLNRSLWRGSNPSLNYYTLLFLSGVISALGLLAGSAATIIGAMIVAPLMGPITGIAFAVSMNNRRLLKRSGMSLLTGAVLTVLTAYLICETLGLTTLNPEITARTRPTLIDLAIALAAGSAGAFAKTRRDVADALPGVAIAVALVPPLSVVGIGIAMSSRSVTVGSTLLFLTNLAGIILSGGLVFVWQQYGSLNRARRGLIASSLLLTILGIPLGLSLRKLVVEEQSRTQISHLVRDYMLTFQGTDIQSLSVESDPDRLIVDLAIAAPRDTFSESQIRQARQFLAAELDRPVELNVRVFPVREFSVPAE